MKRIFLIVLIIAAGLFSCKKMLQEKPTYLVSGQNAFHSITSAQMALNGCYATLLSWNSYGQQLYEMMVGASGTSWGQTAGNDIDQLASFSVLKTNGTINAAWTGLYKTIGECNAFEVNVKNGSLSDDQKNSLVAQARFLRGLSYFYLTSIWGDVPLRLGIITPDNLSMARTPKAEVVNQIIEDWSFAAQHLPANYNVAQDKTMSVPLRYAAYAYLAKLYMMLGSAENNASSPYWTKAKTAGDSVLSANAYALEGKFNDLYFASGSNFSKEILFQVNASKLLDGMGNRTSWLFAPSNSTTGISWGRYRSNKSFYDKFMGTYPNDPRLAASFQTDFKAGAGRNYTYPTIKGSPATVILTMNYSKFADPTNPTIPEITAQSPLFVTRFTTVGTNHEGWPYYRKCVDTTAAAQLGGKNIIVYRYADFLLVMADVYNELGMQSEAVNMVNQVLTRARNGGTTVSVVPANWASGFSQETLREKIFYERLFETVGEPEFFIDTRRRGVEYFRKVLKLNNDHKITQAFVTNVTSGNFRDRNYNNGNLDDNFVKKALLLPIPQSEINTNDKITDADQNFGY